MIYEGKARHEEMGPHKQFIEQVIFIKYLYLRCIFSLKIIPPTPSPLLKNDLFLKLGMVAAERTFFLPGFIL